jgi:hypothetical protein
MSFTSDLPILLNQEPVLSLSFQGALSGAVINGELVGWLERIRRDSDWIEWSASQSYVHRNGFLKVVLAQSEQGRRLVWHSWATTVPDIDSEAHSHRWDFASLVLRGGMRDHAFRELEGSEFAKYEYRSHRGLLQFQMRSAGRASLLPQEVVPIHELNVYAKHYSGIHKAEAEPGSETIVVQDSPAIDHTSVFVDSGSVSVVRRSVRGLSGQEIVDNTRGLLGRLASL